MVIGMGGISSAHAFVSPTMSSAPQLLSSEVKDGFGKSVNQFEAATTGLLFSSAARPVLQINGGAVGQTYVGDTLVAETNFFGGWEPTPTTMTYQWFANGKKIRKASSSSYTLGSGVVGKQIMVRVVGAKESYVTTTKESEPTIAVLAGRTFTASSDPIVTGNAVVGQMLSSVVTPWSALGQTVAYSYQWLRNGKAIKRATGFTYAVTSKDLRKRITVRWKGTAPGYITVVRTSIPTAPVTR
jgi:hypothetical protein